MTERNRQRLLALGSAPGVVNRRIAERQAGETIESHANPTTEVLRACQELGEKLAGTTA